MSERTRLYMFIGGVALLLAAGSATIVEGALALSLNIDVAVLLAAAGIALVVLADVLHDWKNSGRLSQLLHTGFAAAAGLPERVEGWLNHVRALAGQAYERAMCLKRLVIYHTAAWLAAYIVRHHRALAAAIWIRLEIEDMKEKEKASATNAYHG